MSSRSFRRRNNRRRRHPSSTAEGQEGGPQGSAVSGAQDLPDVRPADSPGARRPREGTDAPAGREGAPRREPGRRGAGQRQEQRRGGGQRQAGSAKGDTRQRDARQGGRRGPERSPEESAPFKANVPLVVPDCPVCGKPVRELASALTHRVSRQPAHFDCIVRELRESNNLAPQEKLCYLGGGCFGILEFKSPAGLTRFVIKRRIQYEEKETPADWKKQLLISC